MKLQQLLNIYKDKVHKGIYDYILYLEEDNKITYVYHQEDGKRKTIDKSLSDLLFDTAFLSLLEWKEEQGSISRIRQDTGGVIKSIYSDSYKYHIVNLALLITDQDRIRYIEAFTL